MPVTTPQDRKPKQQRKPKQPPRYEITGKKFTWHPFDDNDELGNVPDVALPLRIKMGTVLDMPDGELDTSAMSKVLAEVAPGEMDSIREMDVNDFVEMFTTWQAEYQKLSGATLGE